MAVAVGRTMATYDVGSTYVEDLHSSSHSRRSSTGNVVVIAVDDNESSMQALMWAMLNVVHEGDEVHVVRVQAPTQVYGVLPLPGAAAFLDFINRHVNYENRRSEEVVQHAKALCRILNRVDVRGEVVVGSPEEALLDVVMQLDADLLVVASDEHRFQSVIERLFIGSLSSYLLEKAPCSVLVVHDTGRFR